MSGIIEGIGVISGVLGIVSFGMDLFGDSSSSSTSVRIAAALNGEEGLSNADGSVAQIRTLNAEEQLLGIGPETYISSGDYADVSVPQSNKQQAVFIELHASDDAVCIAYVSTTWADGSQWLWLGDFGKACDLKWYWSGVRVSFPPFENLRSLTDPNPIHRPGRKKMAHRSTCSQLWDLPVLTSEGLDADNEVAKLNVPGSMPTAASRNATANLTSSPHLSP